MKKLFKISLIIAIFIRFYLQLIVFFSQKFIPFKSSFPYWDFFLVKKAPGWLWPWGNFDGVHYLSIAQEGYLYGLTQAFFPVYPLAIRVFSWLIGNQLIAGLILSHLFFVGFLYFFIKLGQLDYSIQQLKWAVFLLLLFPSSFYFFSLYTESLFLFLTVVSFYLARRKSFTYSALAAGIASGTRLVGIFLLPAIIWEYFRATKKSSRLELIKISFLSSLGLCFYLGFLQQKFHNFMIFIASQPGFGAGRQIDKLVMPYQVIFRYLKMFLTVNPANDIYPVLVFEFFMSIIFIGIIIWAYIKKFRLSYLIFITASFLLPTFTGTFSSIPRYVLTAFPFFYLFGTIKNKPIKISILILSAILLSWAFIRFSRGYWIS